MRNMKWNTQREKKLFLKNCKSQLSNILIWVNKRFSSTIFSHFFFHFRVFQKKERIPIYNIFFSCVYAVYSISWTKTIPLKMKKILQDTWKYFMGFPFDGWFWEMTACPLELENEMNGLRFKLTKSSENFNQKGNEL